MQRKWQKFQYPRLVHEQRKKFAESRVNTGASEVERGDSHFVRPQALRITARVYGGLGLGALGNDVRNAKCDLHQIVHRDKIK